MAGQVAVNPKTMTRQQGFLRSKFRRLPQLPKGNIGWQQKLMARILGEQYSHSHCWPFKPIDQYGHCQLRGSVHNCRSINCDHLRCEKALLLPN